MSKRILPLACALILAAAPALAGGKKEGAGESSGTGGGDASAQWSTLAGPREMMVPPAQASESLGNVTVTATMWAGSGAAKCRVNFVVENYSSANIAMG
ncbi:MAG: hypothetical protein HY055_00165, partial [Magnetospirillum sp.]|nr:hypothetical protein [Magnetospirillum sp.]